MFSKFTESDFNHYSSLFPGRVFRGSEINEDYCHDELGTAHGTPDVLVKVLSTDDVSKVMEYAYVRNLPAWNFASVSFNSLCCRFKLASFA